MKRTFALLLVITAIMLVACKSATQVVETGTGPTETASGGQETQTTTPAEGATATQNATTAPTVHCIDSDNGLSSYISGYVDDIDKIRHNDKCVGNELVEWYCTPEGLAKTKTLICPEGCVSQGTACTKPASVIEAEQQAANQTQSGSGSGSGNTQMSAGNCTDTDNGLTYGTKGTCKDSKSYPSPFADFCTGERDLVEMSCDTTTDSCVQNTYTCSGNCVNGACA